MRFRFLTCTVEHLPPHLRGRAGEYVPHIGRITPQGERCTVAWPGDPADFPARYVAPGGMVLRRGEVEP